MRTHARAKHAQWVRQKCHDGIFARRERSVCRPDEACMPNRVVPLKVARRSRMRRRTGRAHEVRDESRPLLHFSTVG